MRSLVNKYNVCQFVCLSICLMQHKTTAMHWEVSKACNRIKESIDQERNVHELFCDADKWNSIQIKQMIILCAVWDTVLNCQVTIIVMNSGSQLSEMSTIHFMFTVNDSLACRGLCLLSGHVSSSLWSNVSKVRSVVGVVCVSKSSRSLLLVQ